MMVLKMGGLFFGAMKIFHLKFQTVTKSRSSAKRVALNCHASPSPPQKDFYKLLMNKDKIQLKPSTKWAQDLQYLQLNHIPVEQNQEQNLYTEDVVYSYLLPYWYLISRFWRGNISRGFIFALSIGKYEKRALNFAIEAFSTSFYFSKGLNCLKFLDNWNTTKHIFEN